MHRSQNPGTVHSTDKNTDHIIRYSATHVVRRVRAVVASVPGRRFRVNNRSVEHVPQHNLNVRYGIHYHCAPDRPVTNSIPASGS